MTVRTRIPFFIALGGIAGLGMLLPAIVGLQTGDFATARAFFYSALMLAILVLMIGTALAGRNPQNLSREHLMTLAGAYVVLPLIFAVPLRQAVPDTTYLNAVFEMVSCFTTTGASTFDPVRLSGPLHLWRAEVGWLGGLFSWITVAAVLAPLNLGGFEVSAASEPGRGVGGRRASLVEYETGARLIRFTATLAPLYAALTVVLWICLILVGNDPMAGLIRAMGTMSTSGISGAGTGAASDLTQDATELLTFLFLFFALSRRTFSTDSALRTWNALTHDPEIRVGVMVVAMASGVLFASHFWSAIQNDAEGGAVSAFASLRGIIFTTLSFLTTTGYVSSHWGEAQQWSGLGNESFALAGLALLGGGVATTAGGVKLLRVYALYVHSRRELNRLVHPSIVSSRGKPGREVPLRGAYIAWVFFMLFAVSITVVWLGLAAYGLDFDHAMLLAVSALSTTGPLAPVVSGGAVSYEALSAPVKDLLMAAMVVGRLETLAFIALLNAELWRG